MANRPFPRAGAWAADPDGRIGILYFNSGTGNEEFHVVDQRHGGTELVVVCPWAGCRQAKISEIPACRLDPVMHTEEVLSGLGYSA